MVRKLVVLSLVCLVDLFQKLWRILLAWLLMRFEVFFIIDCRHKATYIYGMFAWAPWLSRLIFQMVYTETTVVTDSVLVILILYLVDLGLDGWMFWHPRQLFPSKLMKIFGVYLYTYIHVHVSVRDKPGWIPCKPHVEDTPMPLKLYAEKWCDVHRHTRAQASGFVAQPC